jgi:hypothetical protein
MSLPGPKRQFAAVQRHGRCWWNTGRSVDVADTELTILFDHPVLAETDDVRATYFAPGNTIPHWLRR